MPFPVTYTSATPTGDSGYRKLSDDGFELPWKLPRAAILTSAPFL